MPDDWSDDIVKGLNDLFKTQNPSIQAPASTIVYHQRIPEVLKDIGTMKQLELSGPLSSNDFLSCLRIEEELNQYFMSRYERKEPIPRTERRLLADLRGVIEYQRSLWMIEQHEILYAEHAREDSALGFTWAWEDDVNANLAAREAANDALEDLLDEFEDGAVERYISSLLQPVDGSELEVDTECSICREPFAAEHPPVTLKCQGSHVYGEACIREWFLQSLPQSLTCPMDRQSLLPPGGISCLHALTDAQFTELEQAHDAIDATYTARRAMEDYPAPEFPEARNPLKSFSARSHWRQMETLCELRQLQEGLDASK